MMVIKGYSAFPKAPALIDCLVSYPGHSLVGILTLCRDAVGVFCSPMPTGIFFDDHEVIPIEYINAG